jgi:hypothetical protein
MPFLVALNENSPNTIRHTDCLSEQQLAMLLVERYPQPSPGKIEFSKHQLLIQRYEPRAVAIFPI